MSYFLGVDLGSSSSRAVLFDDNGEIVLHASHKVTLHRHSEGYAEHDPVQLLDSVTRVVHQVLSAVEKQQLGQVSACGIATQRSTVLAWHRNGNALSPALSWQDVRAQGLLEKLKPHAQQIRQLTGLPLTAYYSAGKMNWLLHNAERVKHCDRSELRLSPLVSYLLYHLVENRPYLIDFSNAQRTQLFALDSMTWSERLCNWFDVEKHLLPECMPMVADYGRLVQAGIPVKAVCGDQNAAIFGMGVLQPDVALVNIGSGAFILRELDYFSRSATQLTGIAYADIDTVSYMREATINGAGNALKWAADQWHIENLLQSLPGWLQTVRQPPVFINAVGGLGTPWMQGGIQSSFVGNGHYSAAERVVAVIESIVFMLCVNIELMVAEAPLRKLQVSGGLSELDGLCQKLSDLSNIEVERTTITEATARGVAWLAAGRPEHWNILDSSKDETCMVFMPQQDEMLQARYQLFKMEIKHMLAKEQLPEPGQ